MTTTTKAAQQTPIISDLLQLLIDAGRSISWQCFGDCRAFDEFAPGPVRDPGAVIEDIRAALQDKAGEVKCQTCNGHGLVGGHMQDGSGYGEGCPDCNPDPAPLVKWARSQQPTPVVPTPLKDHQIAAMVSKLRDIAREFHAHDSLRARIANEIVPALKAAPVVPDGFALVLVEPTPEMWQAVDQFAHAGSVWDAMIAASQQKGGQHG